MTEYVLSQAAHGRGGLRRIGDRVSKWRMFSGARLQLKCSSGQQIPQILTCYAELIDVQPLFQASTQAPRFWRQRFSLQARELYSLSQRSLHMLLSAHWRQFGFMLFLGILHALPSSEAKAWPPSIATCT